MTNILLTQDADWQFHRLPGDEECVKFAEDHRFIYYLWLQEKCVFRTDKEFPTYELVEILQNRRRGRSK